MTKSQADVPWITLGTHRYRAEGDIVHLAYEGPLSVQQAETMFDFLWDVIAKKGDIGILVDCRGTVFPSPALRRYFVEYFRSRKPVGVSVLYGASTMIRIATNMVIRMSELISGANIQFAMADDEASARALLATLRASKRERSAGPPWGQLGGR